MSRLHKILMMLLLDAGLSLVGAVGLQHYIEGELSKKLDGVIASRSAQYKASYRRVKVDLWNQSVQIRGILIEPKESSSYIQIDKFTVSGIDLETFKRAATQPGRPTLPKTIRIGFEGLHLTPELLGPKTAAVLKDFGYEELNVSLSSGFLIDRENQVLGLQDLELSVQDMGSVSASVELGQFYLPNDSQLAEGVPIDFTELRNSTLRSFSLSFTDASLVGRINYSLAKAGKPSLAATMKSVEESLLRSPASAGGFAGSALTKLSAFAAQPKTLRLTAKPPTPLPLVGVFSLGFFSDIDQTAEALGLVVEVEP